MKTYLLTWNPSLWKWDQDVLKKLSEKVRKKGKISDGWSTGNRKTFDIDDRLFLFRQGQSPRGIMASGSATSKGYQNKHFNVKGKVANYVDLTWDALLDPDSYPLLTIERLPAGSRRLFERPIQASGIVIEEEQAKAIRGAWDKHLIDIGYHDHTKPPMKDVVIFPEVVDPQRVLVEGAKVQATINSYERNPRARQSCIDHWGYECSVCRFSFKKKYGLCDDYIHVHHLISLSEVGRQYEVDPVNDLRPVCPNCHAMLHYLGMTIPQLKAKLKLD